MKTSFILFTLLICFNFVLFSGFTQTITPTLPSQLYPYSFSKINTSENDHFLVTPFKIGGSSSISNKPEIIDGNGDLIWYSFASFANCSDFKYYPSSQIYSYTIREAGAVNTILLDEQMTILDTIQAIQQLDDVHDIQRAANGNWLFTIATIDTVDLSGATFYNGTNGVVNTIIAGFGVQEVDANNNIVFEWDSNDHIPPTETYLFYGYNISNFDYCHGNAVEEDSDGHLLLSFRHLNAIYKIHRTTGAILWKLGGHTSDFTFTNDPGFSGQHDIRKLPNGNYSLFNNANMAPAPKVSKGKEFSLDTINWTATLVHETVHPTAFYASAMGNYQTTATNNKLLSYGLVYRPKPSASYFDGNNTLLGEMYFADSVVTYRAHHKEASVFPRPEITCELIGTTWFLSTTLPYINYSWSNNETTSDIEITAPGTYQVWVNYGTGMLGSIPLNVASITDPCGALGIEENAIQTEEAYSIYTTSGQLVLQPEAHQLYIKRYASGKTEKWIFLPFKNE